MPARLLLNADDFGLTRGVNRAIAELHQAGALTSASLMANGAAFDDAIRIARANPRLGVGCHVVLVDGEPVSPPESIPALLAKHSPQLRSSLAEFVLALLLGQIGEAEIEREAVAQIEKLQHAGICVTHLDTHKHLHLLPQVLRPLLRAAERTGVSAIRNPFEQPASIALSGGPLTRRAKVWSTRLLRPRFFAQPAVRDGRIRTPDAIIGISATGDLDATSLRRSLASLHTGTVELVCHPGYNDADLDAIATRLRHHRDVERKALLNEIPALRAQPNAPCCIHYGDL